MTINRRQGLAALLAAAPAATTPPARAATAGEGSQITVMPTRAALAAVAPVAGRLFYLSESPREGWFLCVAGPPPAADPLQGLYIASVTPGWHYARVREDKEGRPEWFGARSGDPGFDCEPAIRAAFAMCQTIWLKAADYYIRSTLVFDRSGCCFYGAKGSGRDVGDRAPARMGTAGGSRVILTGPGVAAATVFQFGKTGPGTGDDQSITRNAFVRDILFARDCGEVAPRPSLNADPINCVKGVIMSHMNTCGMDNVSSFDSPVGFHYFGVIASYARDCSAARTTPATSRANDFWVGHLLGDYRINQYIASNASIYLERPMCYDEGAFGTSTGIRLFGYIADTFINDAEVGRVDIGIDIDGSGSDGATIPLARGSGAHQDVRISNAVVDAVKDVGIRIRNLNQSGEVTLIEPYVALGGGASVAIKLDDSEGKTRIAGGRILSGGGTGIAAANMTGLGIEGTYLRDCARPVVLSNVGMSSVTPVTANHAVRADSAVTLIGCFRNRVAPQVTGSGGRVGAGVTLDRACVLNAVEPSQVDPGAFAPVDAAHKVRFDGQDARSAAAFGTNGNVLVGVTG